MFIVVEYLEFIIIGSFVLICLCSSFIFLIYKYIFFPFSLLVSMYVCASLCDFVCIAVLLPFVVWVLSVCFLLLFCFVIFCIGFRSCYLGEFVFCFVALFFLPFFSLFFLLLFIFFIFNNLFLFSIFFLSFFLVFSLFF